METVPEYLVVSEFILISVAVFVRMLTLGVVVVFQVSILSSCRTWRMKSIHVMEQDRIFVFEQELVHVITNFRG